MIEVTNPAGKLVTLRVCSPVDDGNAERFVGVMKADNPRLERSAILIGPESATFVLQLERMVREADSPARRTFRDRSELAEWLRPSLAPEEAAALTSFLATR